MDMNRLIQRLSPPTGKARMVLDTDAACEVDDQFAIVYALLSPERIELEAIHIAPYRVRPDSPTLADTIENSYREAVRLLDMLGRSPDGFVFKGATEYLNVDAPQHTEATRSLIDRAMATSSDGPPLYVGAIGALTNVAAAIRIEPQIIERIVVIWLGGYSYHLPPQAEYNMSQDIAAVQTVFDCGVPLVHAPCYHVIDHLITTIPELEYYVAGTSDLGDYLVSNVRNYLNKNKAYDPYAWSKVLWDVCVPSWLVNADWSVSDLLHSPRLTDDGAWVRDTSRHFVRCLRSINRDAVFRDVFRKLQSIS